MSSNRVHTILANQANAPKGCKDALSFDYRPQVVCDRNMNLSLPDFVLNLYHLPDRVLDLLELASYVFAADRCISRGRKDAVEYHSWSRNINLIIRVRDYDFWNKREVAEKLNQLLSFMMGDDFVVNFQPGHQTPPTGLFDKKDFRIEKSEKELTIALFSGGLDSLAGTLDILNEKSGKVILASHQASAAAKKTQRTLCASLRKSYPDRIMQYAFECNLRGKRAIDETQRSRSFLFGSIAYSLAMAYDQSSFYVFENGITSMNLHRREDLANSRASRTTHPKTIALLQNFYSCVAENNFTIYHPYIEKTKADIIEIVCKLEPNLFSSSVSCTRATFAKGTSTTHCGECFQCIDRRIAAIASSKQDYDNKGLYAFDIVSEPLKNEAKTTLIDYVRQAINLANNGPDFFNEEYLYEISQILEFLPFEGTEIEKVERLWEVYNRHGLNIRKALAEMRNEHDDIFSEAPKQGTLLDIISSREYLKPDVIRLADVLEPVIINGVKEMFAKNKPKHEPDLNEKIGALLRTHEAKFRSECPTVSFACANVIPDHQNVESNIVIEAKYIRKTTSPSKATDGIASDLTKYPEDKYIIFVVYDPDGQIKSDEVFKEDIEKKGRNRVLIIR